MIKHTKLLTLSALLATVVSSGASADDHKFEVRLEAGRTFFDQPLDDANNWGLGLGYVLNENWDLELVANKYDSETDIGAIDLDGTQYRLDAVYNIDTQSQWRPYVAFGVGDQEREFNGIMPTSERDTLVNLGAGLKRSIGDQWEFRTDVRAFNSLDNEYTDLAITAGIGYLIGAAPKAAPVVKPTPTAVQEPDSDGDGVVDSKDQCPDTPRNYKVNDVGCPMELTETASVKLDIKFDTAKAIIKDEYLSEVQKLATFMNQYLNTEVTVEGHTDSQGAESYNQKLSQSRAESVKAALITKFGIEADRVNAVGYGESKPVADNTGADGREQNRRVVGSVSTKVTRKVTK